MTNPLLSSLSNVGSVNNEKHRNKAKLQHKAQLALANSGEAVRVGNGVLGRLQLLSM